MKIISIIIGLFVILNCTKKENENSTISTNKNCNCDRIVYVFKYKIIGNAQAPPNSLESQPTFIADIKTVNDCSGWNKNFEYKSKYTPYSKIVGDCY